METFLYILPLPAEQALGWMVLHSLWQITLIGIVTALALLAARRQSAVLRYRIAGIGLAAVLPAAAGTFLWRLSESAQPDLLSRTAIRKEVVAAQAFMPDSLSQTARLKEQMPVIFAPQSGLSAIGEYFEAHLPLIAVCWALGLSLFLLRLLSRVGYVYYLRNNMNFPADEYWLDMLERLADKAGLRKPVDLVESALARTPIVVGRLKPMILFPIGLINRLDPAEAEAILAHEIAHILRSDYLFNLLQSVVETLFYYHPAIWLLSAFVRREREMAADEMAVSITGNPVQYAKALVTVQELAYFPLSPALAFAGRRKSELFTRIHHILSTKHTKSLAMEKFVGAALCAILLIGLSYAQTSQNLNLNPAQLFDSGGPLSGIWEASKEKDDLCVTLSHRSNRSMWNTHDCHPLTAFSALPNGEGEFTMTREAGTMLFKGKFDGKEGYGRFTFTENADFRAYLQQQNIKNLDESTLLHMFMADVNRDYIAFLRQKGYEKVDADDLTALAVHHVTKSDVEEFISLSTSKKPDLDEIVGFKIHDISKAYIAELSKAGFKDLDMDDIMSAKIHGIDPEFVKSVSEMGFKNADFDDVLSFKIHDVDKEYLDELKKAGLTDLSAEDALSFKIHGINPETIAAYKNLGFKNLDNDELLSLKIHEVDADFLKNMKNLFGDVDTDDLLALKIHEVDADLIRKFREAGFDHINAETAIALKIHDVDPAVAKEFGKMGFGKVDLEDLVNLKIHDVKPEMAKSLRDSGFEDVQLEDVLNVKIHDVDPAIAKEYRQLGFDKIDLEDLINLKIHDVSPSFIRKMREKGFKDLDLDEYVNLKIQYGSKIR